MSRSLLVDTRWVGNHGIGRYANEIVSRLEVVKEISSGHRMSPLDPIRLSLSSGMTDSSFVFYSPGPSAPLVSRQKYAVTIHDLMLVHLPSEVSFYKKLYFDIVIKKIVQNADVVFTVSEFSKEMISEWADIDDDRIIVAPNGVSNVFSKKKSGGSHGDYFLYVGNRRYHKNVIGLIRAFSIFRHDICPDANVKLVMTGENGEKLSSLLADLDISEDLVFLGVNTPDAVLAEYYRNSISVVIPSYYEGFGLPALEGMSSGTPVIASNMTALPEVLGDAGVFIDPGSALSIAEAMYEVYSNLELRDRCIQQGLARSSMFSWDATASIVNEALSHL